MSMSFYALTSRERSLIEQEQANNYNFSLSNYFGNNVEQLFKCEI